VIILTRLGGREMAVNPDLIERAEPTPDTVITMLDGHKLVVVESVDEVIERVRSWRASVAAQAYLLSQDCAACDGWADDETNGENDGRSERAEQDTQAITAHATLDTTLARVLHLPQREE
jgi:flagellar protein FlbD